MAQMTFGSDLEMFDMMRERLYSSVLSDALDQVGLRYQAMRADIRPVWPGAVVVGRALTALSVDAYEVVADPYEKEIEVIDSLKPEHVLVAGTGRSTQTCFWGELLSTAARARGAQGAVIDGYTRDVAMITKMQFPVFATGMKPVDSNGRGIVMDYNCPVSCGDVVVNTGDIIFGDVDGIVAIPSDAEQDVIAKAIDKVEGENKTREELEKGGYLKDVYEKYGIL